MDEPANAAIKALDPETGDVKWQYPLARPIGAGVLATAGGVVFAATPGGNVLALNARTGAALWRFQTGGNRWKWNGGIADELLSGWQTIHRDLGGGCAVRFRPARLNRN